MLGNCGEEGRAVSWVSITVCVVGVSLKAEWRRSWSSSCVPYKLLAVFCLALYCLY